DVMPGSFTVTWTAEPGTGTLALFGDVMGTVPAQGGVLEIGPRHGGNAAASAALGVYRVRVTGLPPRKAVFFRAVNTPLAGGAPLLEPAVGKALYSALTGREQSARAANGLGVDVARSGTGAPVPGALIRVTVAPPNSPVVRALVPLAAMAGDGYKGALAAVDLANLMWPSDV